MSKEIPPALQEHGDVLDGLHQELLEVWKVVFNTFFCIKTMHVSHFIYPSPFVRILYFMHEIVGSGINHAVFMRQKVFCS